MRCGLRSSKATKTSVKSLEPCRTRFMHPKWIVFTDTKSCSDRLCNGLEETQKDYLGFYVFRS